MKSRIYEIGVIDNDNKKHPVYFKEGLNIVTGKSSTGKSALIEIFDYCLGSSEETIPVGKITECAKRYYVCIGLSKRIFVFGRNAEGNKLFVKTTHEHTKKLITEDFFNKKYEMSLKNFKEHLRNELLDISNVDESEEAVLRKEKKESRPTIRSFMSFMLQHQNLIANKHALFYRFDEKEKRDLVINHTKFFLGFVKQEYFILMKEKERLDKEIKVLEKEEKAVERFKVTLNEKIAPALAQVSELLGYEIGINTNEILVAPQQTKDKLERILDSRNILTESNQLDKELSNIHSQINEKSDLLRAVRLDIGIINNSINAETRLIEESGYDNNAKETQIGHVVCPFCGHTDDNLKNEAQKLEQAISKLSNHISHAKKMKAPLEVELAKKNDVAKTLAKDIKLLREKGNILRDLLMSKNSASNIKEMLLEKKYQLFNMIDMLNPVNHEFEKQLFDKKKDLEDVIEKLKKYDWKSQMIKAENDINERMKNIGLNFNFEDEYRPINLKFSLESFDLYHEKGSKKIYLRSMGSGANWLYSHLTLFMALHSYFVSLKDECLIPTTLFLDQPTQVYFPNFKRDTDSKGFSQNNIQAIEGKAKEKLDEDIVAVTNIFNQLHKYCENLKLEYGFCPQIIVTDHADNLELEGVEFEKLVNKNRWRTRGLIN